LKEVGGKAFTPGAGVAKIQGNFTGVRRYVRWQTLNPRGGLAAGYRALDTAAMTH